MRASLLAFCKKNESLAAVCSYRWLPSLIFLKSKRARPLFNQSKTHYRITDMLIGITKESRSLMTNIRIIIPIFDGHIEKHESVSLFLQNEPRKFKCTKDKLITSSYSHANYGVVLQPIYVHGYPRTSSDKQTSVPRFLNYLSLWH